MTEDPTAKAFDQIIATVSPDVLKDYPPQPVPTSPVLPSVDTSSNTGDLRMAAATKMKPENVIQNGFLNDLGKDYVAVDDMGHVIARSDEETIRRSYPNANLFTGSDFPKSVTSPPDKGVENPVLVNPPPGVPTTPSGHPVSDALEKDGAFDHDGDGRIGGSKKGAESTASKGKAKKAAAKK